jgi:hypothetical protein
MKTWSGFGLILLGLLMVILKVTGWLDWSWWLIFLPFYFPFAFTVGVLILFLIGALIALAVVVTIGLIVGIYEAFTENR